jgi:hypothetical protein
MSDAFERLLDRRLGELEQRLLQRLGEPLADLVDELRVMRQLMTPAPSIEDAPHARVMLALATTLGDLELSFESDEVIEATRHDHALDVALRAIGILADADKAVDRFGLWLRAWRNRPLAGYVVRRRGRRWGIERT